MIERNKTSLGIKRCPAWKRVLDLVGAGLALLVLWPVLLASAVAIKWTSPGPVLFRQWRGGHGGKPFMIYKFRTMVPDADARKHALMIFNERTGPVFKMKSDPRVTPVGRFLRQTSIDELPQLFNVIRGEMSLVGPRPLPVEEERGYEPWQQRRWDVKPGLTGIWQVSCRDESDFNHWVRLDIHYVQRYSFLFDLKILAQTIPAVLRRKGAH